MLALAAVAAVVALASVLPAASPAGALATNTLGITPVGEADNFHLELLPGEETERRAVVTNRTDEAHHVRVYPVDATVTAQGGFALGERDATRNGVGAWLQLPVSELTLPPHSSTPLPFRLTVPAAATPGDHAGGIVIETDPKGQPQDLGDNFAVQMNLVERIGVRVYLTVAGQADRDLGVGKLTWERSDQGIRFEVPVTNTGNVRVDPRGELTFQGFRLPSSALRMSRVETLLPGSSVTLTGLWPHPPLLADGTVTATVTFAGGEPVQRSTHLRLLPLPLAAGALLGLALVAFATWRFIRFLGKARAALRLAGKQAGPTANPPAMATKGDPR
jgi:hypothetical protein